jgi:hypothetical protein
LRNLVQEPVQWDDLATAASPAKLISWCELCDVILPMEIRPNGGDGVRLRTAQLEVLTLYLTYRIWWSVWLPPAETRDVLEQEQRERFRLIRLLLKRYVSLDLASPAYPLRAAATESNPERQYWLMKVFLQDTVAQRCSDLRPRPSLLHQPPQLVMEAGCPLIEAYWQLTNLMLDPADSAKHHYICPCGRQFHGRPT